MYLNTTGILNAASGYQALFANTTGSENTANGALALQGSTGNENTATGALSLQSNTTGSGNTASGTRALKENTVGINNTAIGAYADVTTGDLENATAIGYGALVDVSNKIQLGNVAVTLVETEGGLQAAGGQFAVSTAGDVTATSVTSDSVSTTSDARLKETIRSLGLGLGLINDLNPVSYHRINNPESDIEMGLLAQEVEATLARHGLGNSGMVHKPTEDAYRSIRYNDLLAPMIKAIQELDAQHIAAIDEKDEQIALLEQKLNAQEEELLAIVQSQQEQLAQLQRMMGEQFASN
jgi:hypothetical protein